jgi:hypothetical protein
MKKEVIFMLLTIPSGYVIAQSSIKEVTAATRRSNQEITVNQYHFISDRDDTINIRIVDPRGEIISVPVKNRAVLISEPVPFNLNTSYWRRGEYQIVVESRNGRRTVKRIEVRASG